MEKNPELLRIQNKIINTALLGAIILIFPVLLGSMIRIIDFGWQNIYYIHIGISLFVLALFILRKRTSLQIRVHGILILAMLASIAGIYSFKMGGGGYYMIFSMVMAVLFFGAFQGLIYFLVYLLSVILIFFLYREGLIYSDVDFNSYLDHATTWVANVSGHVYVSLVLIYTVNLFYKYFTGSLEALTKNRDELESALNKLVYSEHKFRMLFEGSVDGFVFFNQEFRILDCNSSMVKMVGFDREKVLNKKFTELGVYFPSPVEIVSISQISTSEVGSTGILKRDLLHHDGRSIPVEINIHWLQMDGKTHYWAVVRSVEERKRMERELAKAQIESEERERARYALELHDGMGPLLSTCKIYFHSLDQIHDKDKKELHKKRAIELLDEAMQTIKELSANLSPDILRKYGLEQAIRSFHSKASLISDINISLESSLKERLPDVVEFTVYRMILELINNSLKYSKAGEINIVLQRKKDILIVKYTDDGVGFNYKKARLDKRGFGLFNLENRIKQLGGKYNYKSSPGKGVNVQFSLNIASDD